ncbi:CBS domain-containing protein [Neomegalonema perideroedes]|uniref:CBS domain-containing protein n=1 Tax=Neomegalonema perideroedes TaxID=217219 RepID=UPI000367636D|nr:CBS domain-containing protein [Neomegalonema perideroedes]
MTKVRQILDRKGSQEVESIRPTNTLAEAAARLSERKIGCLLVLDEKGAMVGILSERDIVRLVGREGADRLKDPVSTAMTAKVQSCAFNDDAIQVLSRMTKGRFRHMPVIEGGELVGLVSIGDAVIARIEALQLENEALADLIRSASA